MSLSPPEGTRWPSPGTHNDYYHGYLAGDLRVCDLVTPEYFIKLEAHTRPRYMVEVDPTDESHR